MLTANYNYYETLVASAKANWQIEEIIGGDKRLNFSKPFMPESLERVESLDFSAQRTRSCSIKFEATLSLHVRRGRGVHSAFRAGPRTTAPYDDDYRTRALLQFASEEAKHIQRFRKFAETLKQAS